MSNPWIKQRLENQYGGRGWIVMDYAGNNFALIKDFTSTNGEVFMVEVHEYGASYWQHKVDTHLISVQEYQSVQKRYEESGDIYAETIAIFNRPDYEKHAYLNTNDLFVCTLSEELLGEIENIVNEFFNN